MVLPPAFNFLAVNGHTVVHMARHPHSALYAIQNAFGHHDRFQIGSLQQRLPNNTGQYITSAELTTLGAQLHFFPITLVSTYQHTALDTTMVDIDRNSAEEARQYQLFRNGDIQAVVFMRSGLHYDVIEQRGSRFVEYAHLHPEIRHHLRRPYRNGRNHRNVDSASDDSGGDTTDTEPGIRRYACAHAPARDGHGGGDTTETVPHSSDGDTTDTDVGRQVHENNVQERHSRYMDRNNHVTVDILRELARRYRLQITGPVNKYTLSRLVSRYEIRNGIRPFNETEDTYDIRVIRDHRFPTQSRTEIEFLVEWVGYPHESDHTWEPASGIPRMLRGQYFRRRQRE